MTWLDLRTMFGHSVAATYRMERIVCVVICCRVVGKSILAFNFHLPRPSIARDTLTGDWLPIVSSS